MHEPIINWQALVSLSRPEQPPVKPVNGINMWDDEAARYNKMSALEAEMTLLQVDALPLSKEYTVLDMGCGCGRLSVPIAERVKSVTAMDSSRNMLDNCIANAKAAGRDNVEPLLLDFFEAEANGNVPVHDIAFVSRSAALGDLKKVSTFASKYAAALIFANAPSIPELQEQLFRGTASGARERRLPKHRRDRRIGYNALWNTVYDLGYEPNVSIVDDGFKNVYDDLEAACDDLRMLARQPIENEEIYRQNVSRFLTKREDGKLEFFMRTRTAVIWWKTQKENIYGTE